MDTSIIQKTKSFQNINKMIDDLIQHEYDKNTVTHLFNDFKKFNYEIRYCISLMVKDKSSVGSASNNFASNFIINYNQRQKNKTKMSFIWLGNSDTELEELYVLMKDEYTLISDDNTFKAFKEVFSGKPLDSITPIKWHNNNASEVLYFLMRLTESNNIDSKPRRLNYQVLRGCIVADNGEPFSVNWKQLKQNIYIQFSTKKQDMIDRLVANF
ncbi:hypothetical protein N9M15_00380 [Bacteroidia bacterium]|nr:hypothetical protein [Bacteroidia bacterium]